ncbi:MAG: L,D-transpeptidase family protein [Rhizobiales bacterium]|nr:L,D-transpeptidase family protein [Hyphomicrobiales bacterium]
MWRAGLLAGVFVVAQLGTANAQFWHYYQYRQEFQNREDLRPRYRGDTRSRDESRPRRTNRRRAAKTKDTPIRHPFGENMPKGPLQLMVSIGDQRAVLYSNGIRVADAKVSTGVAGHPTPTGIFSIIQKNRWHRSNLYSNAPMYYMHRLTWSGIALHEGHLPGYPASHGCIRLPTAFVSRLWTVSKLGMRVVVARVEVKPEDISHAKLFNPAQKPVDTSRTSDTPEGLRASLETSGQGFVRVAEAQPVATDAGAVTDAPSAAKAKDAETPSATPHTAAPAEVATSEAAASDAAAAPVEASRMGAAVPTEAPAAPEASAATTEPQRPAIDPNELTVPRPAPLRSRAAEPTKRKGQVAVFISGKEKRIFVRHAFVPVFDMPIEIANPEKPLGTHTYTALQVLDNGTRMRWNVMSMPLTAQPAVQTSKRGVSKQRRVAKNLRGAVITRDSSNATDALDRVTIPQEAIERIAELLTPGSSLIISDEGLGRETGRYTEFIVETR